MVLPCPLVDGCSCFWDRMPRRKGARSLVCGRELLAPTVVGTLLMEPSYHCSRGGEQAWTSLKTVGRQGHVPGGRAPRAMRPEAATRDPGEQGHGAPGAGHRCPQQHLVNRSTCPTLCRVSSRSVPCVSLKGPRCTQAAAMKPRKCPGLILCPPSPRRGALLMPTC